MPYDGPDDTTLPANIKKLSATKRRAFVGAFNSTIKAHPDDESRAFAAGNAAANRAGEKAMPEQNGAVAVGEKHGDMAEMPYPVPVIEVEEPPAPFGGATSFAELDRVSDQAKRTNAIEYTFFQFNDLLQNILRGDLTAGQKVDRMRALVDELGPRVDSVIRDPDVAYKEAVAERGTDDWAPETEDPGHFAAFKDQRGDWRWIAIHTNRYEDKAGEIFADAAHKQYVEWVEGTKQYPPLRFWHVPVDLGPGDFIDYNDGFMVSSGTFHPGMEHAAEALSKMKGMGCSHGYLYNPSDLVDGVYQSYKSFEVSVLPVNKAANRLTQFIAGRDIPMISSEKRDLAVELFGEQRVKAIDEAVAALDGQARMAGLGYRDLAAFALGGGEEGTMPENETTTTATAVADPPAAAAPAAEAATAPAATTEGAAAPEGGEAGTEAAAAEGAPAEGDAEGGEVAPAEGGAAEGDGTEAAEADGTPSASTATASGPVDAVAAKAIEPLMSAFKGILDDALAPIIATQQSQAQEIAALKADDDTKIAAAMTPRVRPSYFDAAASLAAGNEVGEKELPAATQQGVEQAAEGAKAVEGATDPNLLQGIDAYLASARMVAQRGVAGDVE